MNGLALLVESTITEILFDYGRRELQIEVRSPWERKDTIRIVARGIDLLNLDELAMYNIIDRVNLFSPQQAMEADSECASRLFVLMQKKMPEPVDLESAHLKDKLSLIQSGHLTLMEIEPVVGLSMAVLAESITINPTAE